MAKDVCMLLLLIYCASMHGKPYKYTVILRQSVAAVAVAEPVVVGVVVGGLYA